MTAQYLKSKTVFGAAFLASLLGLMVWFASAPTGRCSVYQNLGYVHLVKGTLGSRVELGTAEKWFSSALFAGCAGAPSTFGLGQAYARAGKPAAAVAALQGEGERGGLRRFLIGQVYQRTGRAGDAWREYAQLPRDAAARFYRMGTSAEAQGDYAEALRYLSLATTINPAASKAYYRAAYIYWRELEDPNRAAEMIRQGLAVDPKPSVERDLYAGLLCYYEQNLNCAVASWASAVNEKATLDPDANSRPLAVEMLVRMQREQEQFNLGQLARVTRKTVAR